MLHVEKGRAPERGEDSLKKKAAWPSVAGLPGHDDLVGRDRSANCPKRERLTDVTLPRTEGQADFCAIKHLVERHRRFPDPGLDDLRLAIARTT